MNLQEIVTKRTGKAISQCSNKELYFSLLEMTKGMAEEKVSNEGKRKLYYISAEFLIGKLLSNNLINLGIYDDVKKLLADNGKSLAEIEEVAGQTSEKRQEIILALSRQKRPLGRFCFTHYGVVAPSVLLYSTCSLLPHSEMLWQV